MHAYGIIILAAGSSSRLGRPKQLLSIRGKPLLHHCIEIALAAGISPVITVVGAHADMITEKISPLNTTVVFNDSWMEGMASSIRCGINNLLQISPHSRGAVLMVCDQPFITASLLSSLIATHEETGKPVVASAYSDTLGTPVFFGKDCFADLMELKGQEGAKKIILKHMEIVAGISFPEGNIDIDTAADYERIR